MSEKTKSGLTRDDYVDVLLTFKEVEYLARACRALPAQDKDDGLIASLTLKLNKHARLAKIGEMFGLDGDLNE